VTPTVILQADDDEFKVLQRGRGLLTGSRSAALIALLPLTDCFAKIPETLFQESLPLAPEKFAEQIEPDFHLSDNTWLWHSDSRASERQGEPAWDTLHRGDSHLAVLVWADNIFTFATSPDGACKRMDSIARFLEETWDSASKPAALRSCCPKAMESTKHQQVVRKSSSSTHSGIGLTGLLTPSPAYPEPCPWLGQPSGGIMARSAEPWASPVDADFSSVLCLQCLDSDAPDESGRSLLQRH
jgi:hypothetical protein